MRRGRWMVIAAGLLLLAGDSTWSWGMSRLSGSPAAGVDAQPTLEQLLASELESTNPRLGTLRAERIASALLRYSERYDLPPDLVLAVILEESSARPEAHSSKGAIGLMQVMPHMFDQLAIPGNLAHIETNIEAGCMLLSDNIRRLGEEEGTSAYFWGSEIRGEGYLRRVLRRRRALARLFSRADYSADVDVGAPAEVGRVGDPGARDLGQAGATGVAADRGRG